MKHILTVIYTEMYCFTKKNVNLQVFINKFQILGEDDI